MNSKNNFQINNLKNIVFFGYSSKFEELININSKLDIRTEIITSSSQSKDLTSTNIIFDELSDSLYNFLENNFEIEDTLFISLGSRLIFDKNFIDFAGRKLINFHGSRLPYDAGGGGFSWRIMRGDKIDMQLVHLIDEGIDTGDIISYEESIFPDSCKKPIDYINYSTEKFTQFYFNFISQLKNKKCFELSSQLEYLGSYFPRLDTDTHGYINWTWSSDDIFKFINSFDDPYMGASCFLNNKKDSRLFLKSVHLHCGGISNHPFSKGLIVKNNKKWIEVSVDEKSLLIEKVINLSGENVLNKIKVGDRFFTPNKYLERANKVRVKFNSLGKKLDK